MNWQDYFETMRDWKKLPAYKAEPRIDSLVGFHLQEIAGEYLGDKMRGIIPELPIRLGTVKPTLDDKNYADKSYKVDFFLAGASGRNYFVEFKTDSGSRRDAQDTYLAEAREAGMRAIVEGIVRIASVSSYREKYDHLIAKLINLGLLSQDRQFKGPSDEIVIVYVQPRALAGEESSQVIDFPTVAHWLKTRPNGGPFETCFADALLAWSKD